MMSKNATMDQLPNEVLLQIAFYLNPREVIALNSVSGRFTFLTGDNNHWRQQCYDDSKAASQRRRDELISHQSPATAAFARAMNELPAIHATEIVRSQTASHVNASRLANWDPTYPREKPNFYQEYVHRHAPFRLSWFEQMSGNSIEGHQLREATGAGLFYDADGRASKLYAPLDDGSIGVWEAGAAGYNTNREGKLGRQLGASEKGSLLREGAHTITDRETGVVDCVSVDSRQRRGHFAIGNDLVEVDMETLKTISRHAFPSPINALSEAEPGVPLTVGTTFDLHMFDARSQRSGLSTTDRAQQDVPLHASAELIHSPIQNCATLSQPGPLSILHSSKAQSNSSIWVAGRFTHLLNYDRRYFPRLRGTIHSGARISSLASLPYPYVRRTSASILPWSHVQAAQELDGSMLIAAGAYKGKGSLELYGFSDNAQYATLVASDSAASGRGTFVMTGNGSRGVCAQNRQTASSSKLLSVTNHGHKIVYTDGDAKIKWIERDGFTAIREFSVTPTSSHSANGFNDQLYEEHLHDGLWAQNSESYNGDIVQKLIPTLAPTFTTAKGHQPRLHEDNLIIWTGDGRLGMLGFGKHNGWDEEAWREMADVATAEHSRLHEEREHGVRMRRALQWQADEARFMNGLGLPFARSW